LSEIAIVKYHIIDPARSIREAKRVKKWAMLCLDIEQAITSIAVLEQPIQKRFELAQGLGKCLDHLVQKYPNHMDRMNQAINLNVKTPTGIYKEIRPIPEKVGTFLFYTLCLRDQNAVDDVVRKLVRFVAGEDVGVISATDSPETVTL